MQTYLVILGRNIQLLAIFATVLELRPPSFCKQTRIDSHRLHNFQIKAETGEIYDYTSIAVLLSERICEEPKCVHLTACNAVGIRA